jgi:uncharacterized protein (TIGR03083 family)
MQMDRPSDKATLLALIRQERAGLATLIAGLDAAQWTAPAMGNGWSIKDLLAHIAAWESLALGWIAAGVRGENPAVPAPGLTWDDLDRLNAQIYAANRDRSRAEVQAEAQRSYAAFLVLVESLSEPDIVEPGRFTWAKGGNIVGPIAANSYEHYQEHGDEIRAWLDRSGSAPAR